MGVCQKNCAIDYSKCLVLTFDMFTCSQQEAACALDCLKSAKVKFGGDRAACSDCRRFILPPALDIIRRKGCLLAEVEGDFAAMCKEIPPNFWGHQFCSVSDLSIACPDLAKMIKENNTFGKKENFMACWHLK